MNRLTCNIVASRQENVVGQLKILDKYFDKIRYLNCNPSNPTMKCLITRFDVEYYEQEFGVLAAHFNFLLDKAEVGEWWMYMADDETPSQPLLDNLYSIIDGCDISGHKSVSIPFINERDYNLTHTVEEKMRRMYRWLDRDIAREFGISLDPEWACPRIYKIDGVFRFAEDYPVHLNTIGYNDRMNKETPYPILHKKPMIGFMISCLWQSVCDDWGKLGSVWFKDITKEDVVNIHNTLIAAVADSGMRFDIDGIVDHLVKGNIAQSLKDWMWKYKDRMESYIYPWFSFYFLHCHPEELPEDFWDHRLLDEWKTHILSNRDELGVLESQLHPILKRKFLKRGITKLERSVAL